MNYCQSKIMKICTSVFFYDFYSFNTYILFLNSFWVKFCIGCEVEIKLHSFKHGYPVVPAAFIERTVLPALNCFGTVVQSQLP